MINKAPYIFIIAYLIFGWVVVYNVAYSDNANDCILKGGTFYDFMAGGLYQNGDYKMMDKSIKQDWVEALRSGQYQQTVGVLRNILDGSYCCLGVLCEVAGIPIDKSGIECAFGETEGGYKPIIALLQNKNAVMELYDMNDRYHKTFPEIADWIEENL